MKLLMIMFMFMLVLPTIGICSQYPIPTYKNNGTYYITSYYNYSSNCNEYYLQTKRGDNSVTLSIHYSIPDYAKDDFNTFKNSKVISTCRVSSSYLDLVILVKYNEPRNGKTHGIYLAEFGTGEKMKKTHFILDFTPEVKVMVKEVIKTVYVTNTISNVCGDITPRSDGKYESINFNFHK